MIFLISGENTFLSFKKLLQIKEKYISKNKDSSNVEELDENNFSLATIEEKISSMSFFSNSKLIIIKNPTEIKIADKDKKKIESLIKNAPKESVLVFYEKKELPKKNFLISSINRYSDKNWVYEELKRYQLEKWAKNEIERRKSNIEKNALEKLLSYTGENIWTLAQEIEKLTLYKKKLEEKDIEKMVSAKIDLNIFELIDSIGERNKKKSLEKLEKILEKGENPIYILGMIVYQIKNLLLIKDLLNQGKSTNEITTQTKKRPFVVKKTINQSQNFSISELENIYLKMFKTENSLKRGIKKSKIELTTLVANLCN